MTAVQVPSVENDAVWGAVSGFVAAALEHSSGEYSLRDVRAALDEGRWQLWTDGVSVACTSVVEYPARRLLYVHVAAGERYGVVSMWPVLQEFAIKNRCGAVQFFGRPGWKRSGVLPDGWNHTHDVITVEI